MSVVKRYIINRTELGTAFPSYSNSDFSTFRSTWLADNLVQATEEFSEDGLTQTVTLIFEDQAQLDAFNTACADKATELGITPGQDVKSLIEADSALSATKEIIT